MAVEQGPGEGSIRVLVADDTQLHTQLLGDALRRDRRLEVLCPGRDLIGAAAKHKIQVGIISCNLEEGRLHGLEIVRELRGTLPNVQVVMLMDSAKREAVVEAFRAGARGIVGRNEALEALSNCVRAVHEGQIWASGEQLVFAVEALAASPSVRAVNSQGLDVLSKRELDVVRCLADGLTNREIAERLGLSQHTIKNYLFRVFDKLGVSSRMELLFLTLAQPGAQSAGSSMLLGSGLMRSGSDLAGDGSAGNHRTAQEGSPMAQMELARIHHEGNGVPKDALTAYMWYLIAERTCLELRNQIAGAKRQLAEILTAEQLVEAQSRAAERITASSKTAALVSSAVASGAAAPGRLKV